MKKKFTFPLDDDLKPDLAALVRQAEAEFTEIAARIYDKIEPTKGNKKAFDMSELYQTDTLDSPTELPPEDVARFFALVEEARLETLEIAARIYKDEI